MGLGLFGSSAPTLDVAPLDPTTQQIQGDMLKQTTKSDSALKQQLNEGVGASGNQALQTDAQAKQENAQFGNAGLGGAGLSQAIRNQYNGIGGKRISDVEKSNNMGMPMFRSQMVDAAVKARFAQKQIDNQNYTNFVKSTMDADMARANVLYGVLSSVGVATGAVIGGSRGGGRRQRAPGGYNNYAASGFNSEDMLRESNMRESGLGGF